MRTLFFAISLFWFFSCGNGDSQNTSTASDTVIEPMPAETDSTNVKISDLNCWVERGKFFIAGVCDNQGNKWHRIWLRIQPMDSTGQAITCDGQPSAVIRTFSDAVPPRGRTSFFAGWPLSAFSGIPDSCMITGAGALEMPAGPILINIDQSGVRVLVPDPADSTKTIEKAWQASVIVENPLEMEALHPKVELLIYGSDKRLWLAQMLDPQDPNMKSIVGTQGSGPMRPHEQRRIGTNIFYTNLPQRLQDILIGRVDFLPFEGRPK